MYYSSGSSEATEEVRYSSPYQLNEEDWEECRETNPPGIARQVMGHRKVKEAVLKEIGMLLRREMKVLCKKNPPSTLRETATKSLETFT